MNTERRIDNFLALLILLSMSLVMIFTAGSLLAAEKQIGKASHKIIVGAELDYPPYSFLDEEDRPYRFQC